MPFFCLTDTLLACIMKLSLFIFFMERNKLIGITSGTALLTLLIVYGGFSIVKVHNDKVDALQAQITQQTQRGDELVVTLADTTKELSSKSDELSALQTQYGVAVSDKTKAEGEASVQKKAAATSATEASKQKSIASTANANLSVCTNNKDALANAAYYMAEQRDSYASSTYYLAQAAIEYINGNYAAGNSYIDSATYYQNQAKGYDATISYWIDQIK
jgi:hypothetical protein